MPKKLLIVLLLVFTSQQGVYCQDSATRIINQKSAGILIEYGQPYYYLCEGTRYYVAIIGGNFNIPLFKAKKIFNISVDLFPHYGYVSVIDDKNYYELGFNVRLGFNFSLSPKDIISTKIGSGPHYITVVTEKQSNGFIFSDYYLITYKRSLNKAVKPILVELEFGYRHLSNAGIKSPNRSISNFIFGLGFYKVF